MLAALTKTECEIKRLRLEISGVVQGVGFRPFVYSAAKRFCLEGFVGNESKGVFVEIEGNEDNLTKFQSNTVRAKYMPPEIYHILLGKEKSREFSSFSIPLPSKIRVPGHPALNSSQKTAVEQALSRPFTIIQVKLKSCNKTPKI